MTPTSSLSSSTVPRDLAVGLIVFLVALSLCLEVALASNAPLLSGVQAGIVARILVAFVSRSQTSVSGPEAGVATQIASFESFPALVMAVIIAGLIQIAFWASPASDSLRISYPTALIKGLLGRHEPALHRASGMRLSRNGRKHDREDTD